jgi:predicted phosphodiesterase
VLVLGVLVWQPWDAPDRTMGDDTMWQSLDDYLTGVSLPAEVRRLEISTDVTTDETRRLIQSAIDGYADSKTFYAEAAEAAAQLDLRNPLEGDTVALLVADRHDNIGMDPVARAIAEAGGATVVLDAGDDTSTGEPWEAFSLDSLAEAFDGLDRYAVAGNHDHGSFVSDYLRDRGWTTLDGEVVDGPGGSLIVGVNDPRSSGLGNWRDESGLSFDDQAEQIADDACDSAGRVNTLLVHDADSGTPALARGCVDLVLAGHLHLQVGPTKVVGTNGETGYSYTNGTTGGAAYAIAVGSKLRRPAEVTLVTYHDGRPVGLQPVMVQTNGAFEVGAYLPLDLS